MVSELNVSVEEREWWLMGSYFICQDVKCKRYKYESPQVVYCKGIGDNTELQMAFKDRRIALNYKKYFCRCHHERCPLNEIPIVD